MYTVYGSIYAVSWGLIYKIYNSGLSPCVYFVGVTEEMILRDFTVSSCMSVQGGLSVQWE